MTRHLYTIPMSHYCEKVRWALEFLDLPYEEHGHLQVFHFPVARWYGGGPYVPVLVDGERALTDSTRINRALDEGHGLLYPAGLTDDVLAWEERLDERLGVEGRRWIYLQVLDRPDPFLPYAAYGAPPWQLRWGRRGYGMMRRALRRRLNITDEAMARGRAVIEDDLRAVEDHLAAGHRYLVGDRFTAADLTFAALMAPLILPERYGIPLPTIDLFDAEGAAFVDAMRSRPAGRFAARLIEAHRPVPPWMRAA